MEVLTKNELLIRQEEMFERIEQGEVFIHPTDTIYGLSCNATDAQAVKKVRQIKERPDTPLSVWAPSIEWITAHCEINDEAKEWLNKLPGPYTLILPIKKQNKLAKNLNPKNGTIGVRLPDHWFSQVVEALGFPVVTTSANKTGRNFMTSLEDLDSEVKKQVGFIVHEGEKIGRPSQIVNLAGKETTVKKR